MPVGLTTASGTTAGACPNVRVRDCGRLGYNEALVMQASLAESRAAGNVPDTILILEHDPVITLGTNKASNMLRKRPDIIEAAGVRIVESGRGGGATAHNPGQLVCYPVLGLRSRGLGPSEYIRALESAGIDFLRLLGVTAGQRKGLPGLWAGGEKIASVGVRITRGVSLHGMALNICNDLGIFDLIVPCGLSDVRMTSVMKVTGRIPSMTAARRLLARVMGEYFGTEKTGSWKQQ
jgi:lipoate-protein ligase B